MPVILVHHKSKSFRDLLGKLPDHIQDLAHSQYALLKENPSHPSVRFKRKSPSGYYSARVNDFYRALAVKAGDGSYVWFWIGDHRVYDRMIKHKKK